MSRRKQWSPPSPGERWTAEDGRAAVSAWRRSGLTLREFAREHELGISKVSWWKHRLETEKRTFALAPMIATPSTAVVTVRVAEVEIEVGDADRVSAQWLATLVAELATRIRA